MRNIFFIMIAASILMGCKDKTKQTAKDTTSHEIKPRQETFDDFLIRFKSDSTFQRSHILFPLKVSAIDIDDKAELSKINSTEWTYAKFDGYILTTDKVSKDTTKLIIQKEDTGLHVVYYFARHNGSWRLAKIEDSSD